MTTHTGTLSTTTSRGEMSLRVVCSCGGWESEIVSARIGAGVVWDSFDLHRQAVEDVAAVRAARRVAGLATVAAYVEYVDDVRDGLQRGGLVRDPFDEAGR